VRELGINWGVADNFGWGILGRNIATTLASIGDWRPILLREPGRLGLPPLDQILAQEFLRRSAAMRRSIAERSADSVVTLDFPVLHALGNGAAPAFASESPKLRGGRNAAVTFMENTFLTREQVRVLNDFDRVVGGSSWITGVLAEWGVEKVQTCLQGIDRTIFHPAPSRDASPGKFLIFSAGKFEFRKSQDAVVAAFRNFHQRHPDAALIAVWGNDWPRTEGVGRFSLSRHIQGPPPLKTDTEIDWPAFAKREALPGDAFAIFNNVRHGDLGQLIRQCDVAIFPNRAEGGTNLAAMEAMACGIPTILSANTGHLDLIGPENCLALHRQGPVALDIPDFHTDGWGEPDVEEMVETLEHAYQDRDAMAARGHAGAQSMEPLSWDHQVPALLSACGL
jgi:glycosyltransferase involved in cell wall biosynthesis